MACGALILSSPRGRRRCSPPGCDALGLLGLIQLDVFPIPSHAAPVAAGAEQHSWPAATLTSPTTTPTSGRPASAATAGAPAGTARTAPTTPVSRYVVSGIDDWGPSVGPTLGGRTGVKAPAATIPAAGAAIAIRAERGRSGAGGPRCTITATNIWTWTPTSASYPTYGTQAASSESGAGHWGSPEPHPKAAVTQAAGLTMLAGDEFGGGPRMPMVPRTWDQDGSNGANGSNGQEGSNGSNGSNGQGAKARDAGERGRGGPDG